MEIKTCEQYVLDQLEQARAERDWLRGKLEQAQDEAEELRGKLMERGERDASKVEQAIRKEGRRKLYRDGTGYSTSVDDGGTCIDLTARSPDASRGGGEMSCYIIELADCALTPYAIETESGTEYGWGLMPKRKVDLDELLRVADECDEADVDGVTDWAARIRKAVGE